MTLRRVTAVLTALLLMHLSVAASDAACATHAGPGQHASSSHAGDMSGMSGMNTHPAGQHSESKDRCDTPITPECCSAQASCAPTITVAEVLVYSEPMAADSVTPDGSASSALLRFTAPETPPPRA